MSNTPTHKATIDRIKDGEVLTFSTLTQAQLIDMGYNFPDKETHANFYLSHSQDRGFSLCATAVSNDPYTVFSGTENLGGEIGIEELIRNGGGTFDHQWVARNGKDVELA